MIIGWEEIFIEWITNSKFVFLSCYSPKISESLSTPLILLGCCWIEWMWFFQSALTSTLGRLWFGPFWVFHSFGSSAYSGCLSISLVVKIFFGFFSISTLKVWILVDFAEYPFGSSTSVQYFSVNCVLGALWFHRWPFIFLW